MYIGLENKVEGGPGRHFVKWTRLQVPGAREIRPLVFHTWSVYHGPATSPCPAGPSAEGRRVPGSRRWLCGWLGRPWRFHLPPWEQGKT